MAYKKIRQENIYEISSADDLLDLAVSNVITISEDTKLNFITTSPIVTSVRFEIVSGELFMESSVGPVLYYYVGGGTLFSTTGASTSDAALDVNEVNFFGNGTGTLISWDSVGIVEFDNSAFVSWLSLGSIIGSQFATFRNIPVLGFGTGIDLDVQNLFVFTFGAAPGSPTVGKPLITFKSKSTSAGAAQITNTGRYNTDPYIFIDPSTIDGIGINITLSTFFGSDDIFDTTGNTGTFTSVSAVSSSDTITSVTDNSGVARFNFTGSPPVVYVGEEITISGFVTNTTYNGTFIITATDGTSYFECREGYTNVAYTGTEASVGSFSANSVTITSNAHGLSDGDTLTIDCDGATDYDGGYTIYNALTNTFQINATYTATQTGSWSTKGLDQTDPRVLAFFNPGHVDSKYLLGSYVNANTTNSGTIVNGTYKDCVFGTSGSALNAGENNERWKLIDDVSGTFEYIGNEPFSGLLSYDFTAYSSGGNEDFKFKWVKDSGSGFTDLDDPVESLLDIGADSSSVSKTQHLNVVKGDQIKPQVTRVAGTSTVVISYATINAQQ